jgi:putative zinc finger protein
MEQLPKIASKRLQSSPTGEHPDPDLLTAFAEQSLKERERTQVLEHLSHCRECRNVLSLAAPETVLAAELCKTQPAQQTSGRLRGPVLRWGALAACLVVVSSVGLLYRERISHPLNVHMATEERSVPASDLPKEAKAENPPTAEPQTKEGPETRTMRAATPANKALAASKNSRQADHLEIFAKSAPAAAPAAQSGAPAARLGFNAETNKLPTVPSPSEKLRSPAGQQGAAAAAAAAMPADSREPRKDERVMGDQAIAEAVEVAPAIPAREVKSAKRKRDKGGATELPKQVDSDVTKTQAAFAKETLASTAASTSGPVFMRDLKSARWSLSEEGLPQRSLDAGQTWEKIRVDHSAGFRALSAEGFDVWVGGAKGALYHSSDLGMHWTRVTPVIEGAVLSADIVRIEFNDSNHGKLITAENQTLVTSDGGKSWQKQ